MSKADARVILSVQALRALAYGFGSVLVGDILARKGFTPFEAGSVFTAMLAGMGLTSVAVGLLGRRLRRRTVYTFFLLLMAAAGVTISLTLWLPALILAALSGTLSTDPNESGPITSLEQAMLGEAPSSERARVFGRYNAVAFVAGSFGSLAAGGPTALRSLFPTLPPDQRFLFLFPVIALASAFLATRLSGSIEPAAGTETAAKLVRGLGPSRRTVKRLSALFALDAGAGGFIVQSFLAFWFHRRFGTSAPVMGMVFFGTGLLQAGSSIVAGRLAGRIGLLNTMVFTHLPSNVLLALVPFSPTFAGALALLIARFALSQMDVPARQAYIATMVTSPERTAAAAYTNTARYVARPFGPAGAGALMQHAWVGAPFLAAGGLKIVYDLLIYRTFRRAEPPEEREG